MKASKVNLYYDFLDSSSTFYKIPVYQRNYSWTQKQCDDLINDVLKIYDHEYDSHFIGLIVFKPESGDSRVWNIIDGQQRLTTILLLVKVLQELSEDDEIKNRCSELLIDKYKKEIRLIPVAYDNSTFNHIIKDEASRVKNKASRLYQNYMYFKTKLENSNTDIAKLFDCLTKLEIIKMELEYQDHPQIIFESINSTGLSLTTADLIRNYLLMNEEYDIQVSLYNKYWAKFEEQLGVNNIPGFFEHFLVTAMNRPCKKDKIYEQFKYYMNINKYSASQIFEIIDNYIDCYVYLVTNKQFEIEDKKLCKRINKALQVSKLLDIKVVNMFLMHVIKDYFDNKISAINLVNTIELTNSYLFRRSVCEYGTNAVNNVFMALNNQIYRSIKNDNMSYEDSVAYNLIYTKENTHSRFPANDEFIASLKKRDLYGKFKYTYYLLVELENSYTSSIIDIINEELTIEHIMPQSLTRQWKDHLGVDYEILHAEYVHDLGNLTLTSQNSKLSNNYFELKTEILKNEAHLKLNEEILKNDEWTIDIIENRGEELANRAASIWEFPSLNQELFDSLEEKYKVFVDIDEIFETDYSKRIESMVLPNESIVSVKNYRQINDQVVSYIIKLNPEIFDELVLNSERVNNKSISKNMDDIRYNKEFSVRGYYFNCDKTRIQYLSMIKAIAEICNVDLNEFKFYVKLDHNN